jgi:cytochrome c biogenesis protein CcmG/thiol:disulfide interchange protein DsbE
MPDVDPPPAPAVDARSVGARRRRPFAPFVALAVGVVVVALFAVLATRSPASDRAWRTPLAGKVAPAIVGTTLDGSTFDLGAHRGRWVVVNFFATWCTPCIKEHPELVRFDERHRASGDAALVSVLFADTPEAARTFFAENGGDWPVVVSTERSVAADYGFYQPPESYLIDPDGVVYGKFIGGVTDSQLEAFLQDAKARVAESASHQAGQG